MKHILIISGGSIDAEFAWNYMSERQFDMVISADSGLEFCRQMEIFPDLILGDFDSASRLTVAFFQQQCPERIRTFPAKKDWTDTELAIREGIREGADCITVLGATGTRLDHVMGNIQLLKQALDRNVECVLVDANNRVRMIRNAFTLKKSEQFGKYVSLIPFTSRVTGLTLKGFAYNLQDFTLTTGITLGISNEISGEEASVELGEGILLVIESRD